jgi:hypothetical protein
MIIIPIDREYGSAAADIEIARILSLRDQVAARGFSIPQ